MNKKFEPKRTMNVHIDKSTLWMIKNEVKEDACTIVHCTYVAKRKFINGGWVNIHAKTALHKPDGFLDELELLHAINVPIAPAKHHFSQVGEVIRFALYFPALPADWTIFNLVEDNGYDGGFTVFKIPRNSTGVYKVFLK